MSMQNKNQWAGSLQLWESDFHALVDGITCEISLLLLASDFSHADDISNAWAIRNLDPEHKKIRQYQRTERIFSWPTGSTLQAEVMATFKVGVS